MQVLLQLVVALTLAIVALSNKIAVAQNQPGRLLLWSNQNLPEPKYITKTVNTKQASDYFKEQADDHEVVILLTPSPTSTSCMHHSTVQESMSQANDQNVFQYVYPSASGDSIATMMESNVKEQGSYRKVPITAVADTFQKEPELFSNNKVDVIEIELVSEDDALNATLLQALLALLKESDASRRVLFAAYDQVQDNVAKPAQYGGFSRILQSSSSSGKSSLNTDGIYYKPEGAEYAIYYADTYLYITPDIFTGLLTGIFVFFTLLTGISCLGSIQGMTSFYDKLPIVGKEA